MPDVRESNLPKITNYSDIKELRLVKTDGSSVSMTVENFINAVAEKIARVDGFASVVAELLSIRALTANDVETLHKDAPVGLSVYSIIGSTLNSPFYTGGVIFNISRYNPLNTFSVVFQLAIPASRKDAEKVKYRLIHREGTEEVIGSWINL